MFARIGVMRAEARGLCIRLDQRPGFSRIVRMGREVGFEACRVHTEQMRSPALSKRNHQPRYSFVREARFTCCAHGTW
jgi:hypothetical protein